MWVLRTILYAFLAWVFTIFFSPLLILGVNSIHPIPSIGSFLYSQSSEYFSNSLIFGFIFSLPAFALFTILCFILLLTKLKIKHIKFILVTFIITIIFITMYWLETKSTVDGICSGLFYSLTGSVSILSLKLDERKKSEKGLP